MNHWQGTAILKKDPIMQQIDGKNVLSFTVCNTEKIRDPSGAILGRHVLWMDCRWVNPEQTQVARFVARSVVYLEGPLYQRHFTRVDGSTDWGVALDVLKGVWVENMPRVTLPDNDISAD